MALISFSTITDGSTATASQVNTPLTTIYNDYNGNITNANIAANAAIAGSKLAFTSSPTGLCVQQVNTVSSAVASGTTVIPWDDTIPQNTEGDQYMSLAITPKSTTNILVITVVASLSTSGAAKMIIGAIFQDTTANALAANSTYMGAVNASIPIVLTHTMVAGTISSTTFKFRAGAESAGTTTINGVSGVRKFGGITASSIVITEYIA